MTKFLCGYLLLSAILMSASDMPEPYHSLKVLPYNAHSFYSNAREIERLFARNNYIKIVIEVGSWLGASTLHIAFLLPADGKLYAVDHWRGSEEHQRGQKEWIPAMDYLYQQFLSNVVHKKLTHIIVPVRMSSLEAAASLNVRPDLVYLDASHDTPSVYADLKAWFPFVKGHGILCGDDWTWPSVVRAVEKFAREHHLRIEASGNFWALYETM